MNPLPDPPVRCAAAFIRPTDPLERVMEWRRRCLALQAQPLQAGQGHDTTPTEPHVTRHSAQAKKSQRADFSQTDSETTTSGNHERPETAAPQHGTAVARQRHDASERVMNPAMRSCGGTKKETSPKRKPPVVWGT